MSRGSGEPTQREVVWQVACRQQSGSMQSTRPSDKVKQVTHTLSLNNSLDTHLVKETKRIHWVIGALFVLTVVLLHVWSHVMHLENIYGSWFSICDLDEIKQDRKELLCNALYFAEVGHWTPYPFTGLSGQMGDKNKPCCQESVKSPAAPRLCQREPYGPCTVMGRQTAPA